MVIQLIVPARPFTESRTTKTVSAETTLVSKDTREKSRLNNTALNGTPREFNFPILKVPYHFAKVTKAYENKHIIRNSLQKATPLK